MFEKLMETFMHILFLLPCTTGASDEGWELWSKVYPDLSYLQVLSRLGMGGKGQLGFFSNTTEHFKHPQTSVEHGRVGGQRRPDGLWDSHLPALLRQPRWSSRSAWLGHTASWFSLHPDKL